VTSLPAGWATVVVRLAAEELDEVSGRLWAAGVAGIEERDERDGSVELRAGVAASALDAVVAALADHELSVEAVADDGGDAWRAFARSWRAGERLVVVPAWLDPSADVHADDLVVTLDPGRAFGSGAHPTTRLCLAELEQLVRPGDAVADVGCGSGVLAVVAARLGARPVRAVDVDPEAVRATAANALANGVGDVVVAADQPATALPRGAHDLVVANIGAAVLIELAPALVGATAPGGRLVLSGVLAEQVEQVAAALVRAGATLEGERADGEWRALLARHPDDGVRQQR
jgi:ribosomal protein L11 methyltransferase